MAEAVRQKWSGRRSKRRSERGQVVKSSTCILSCFSRVIIVNVISFYTGDKFCNWSAGAQQTMYARGGLEMRTLVHQACLREVGVLMRFPTY